MKIILFIGAALSSSGAFAGIHVENVTRDITTKAQQGGVQTMLVQDGMMRTNASNGGVVILKGSTIIMIDDKRKTYREMTKEDLKKMAAGAGDMMAKMQEHMKNMTPEQRAQMEKMMGNRIPGGMGTGAPDSWESKNLGTTATVEDRKCQNWNLLRNGVPFQELCVVPYNTLPGKEDFQKVFKEMADAFGDLAQAGAGRGFIREGARGDQWLRGAHAPICKRREIPAHRNHHDQVGRGIDPGVHVRSAGGLREDGDAEAARVSICCRRGWS